MASHLRIEKLVYGGDGLARLPPAPDGRRQAVFVPFTLPGELVRVELLPPARGRVAARLLDVLEPSPDRIAPGCEYFGRCGGCQWQHTTPECQLALKREILLETLQRTGGVAWPGAVALHHAEAWGYRNRIRLQAIPGVGIGYYQPQSRRMLPITHCPIASPELNRGLAELAAQPPLRREEIELAVDNADGGLTAEGPLEFAVAGYRYRVGPGSFFQVNRFLAEELVAAALGEVAPGQASGHTALDLFSGVGLFALPLAARFETVEAVESDPAAVADLRHNARGARIRVAQLHALDYLRGREPGAVDLVVADPPRAGLGAELVGAIVDLAPLRLHLVSCDPATLGRDLRPLLAAGYQIRALHLFDLFPQTYHLETVVHLARV
ncbi:MAG TPA: class I SAM-dependent RNA methyltransferase [Terriglobales bacterium]|nr:class I SAM-dependent RNA methyltransferase [Terriglobales bacterium]